MCTGQRPSNALSFDSPLIYILTIFYLVTIVGVTIRMQLHKRNSNLTQTTTAEGVDSRNMGNFFFGCVDTSLIYYFIDNF